MPARFASPPEQLWCWAQVRRLRLMRCPSRAGLRGSRRRPGRRTHRRTLRLTPRRMLPAPRGPGRGHLLPEHSGARWTQGPARESGRRPAPRCGPERGPEVRRAGPVPVRGRGQAPGAAVRRPGECRQVPAAQGALPVQAVLCRRDLPWRPRRCRRRWRPGRRTRLRRPCRSSAGRPGNPLRKPGPPLPWRPGLSNRRRRWSSVSCGAMGSPWNVGAAFQYQSTVKLQP